MGGATLLLHARVGLVFNYTQGQFVIHGTMDEAGVSSEDTAQGPSQIPVNAYPAPAEEADNGNRENKDKRRARYPYASIFFLLGNTVGQR